MAKLKIEQVADPEKLRRDALVPSNLRLGTNTDNLEWMAFIWQAAKRFKFSGLVFVGTIVIATMMMTALSASIAPSLTVIVGISTFGIAFMVAYSMLKKSTTRTAFLIDASDPGNIDLDLQKWWRDEFLAWPDAMKKDYGKERVLFIERKGTRKTNTGEEVPILYLVDPLVGELPDRSKSPGSKEYKLTPDQMAAVESDTVAFRTKWDWRDSRKDAIEMSVMGFVIGGGLIAMYMGFSRGISILSGDG